MRRTTLFLLVLGSAVLSAASAEAQMFRRRVVYTDPYNTWTYAIPGTNVSVTDSGLTNTTTPATTQVTTPATTSNGQVVYQSSYSTPSTVYYSYPYSSGYYYSYPSSSYYTPPSSSYYSYPNGTNWTYPTYYSSPTGYYPVDNWMRNRIGRWR